VIGRAPLVPEFGA